MYIFFFEGTPGTVINGSWSPDYKEEPNCPVYPKALTKSSTTQPFNSGEVTIVAELKPDMSSGKIKIITESQLESIGWSKGKMNLDDLNNCLCKYGITELNSIRHFISQCSKESSCGAFTKELLTKEGNTVVNYEGRKDLGNTQKGDGLKYRGAGYIQLTGRYNYQKFSDFMEDPKIMDGVSYVATNYPWSSAGFWWNNNKMNELCKGSPTVKAVTTKVNGGCPDQKRNPKGYDRWIKSLAEREKYFEKCVKHILETKTE